MFSQRIFRAGRKLIPSAAYSTLPKPDPLKRRSLLRNVGRVLGGVAGLGVIGGGAYYATLSPEERSSFRTRITRGYTFWSTLFPIYLNYRLTEFRLSGLPEDVKEKKWNELHEKYAGTVLDLILELKGLYIKLGQVGASRKDILPKQYRERFTVLYDSVPSRPGAEIREIVCKSLGISKIEEKFSYFNDTAIGAASIGQVHEAKLLDGTDVVVKVQYPDSEFLFVHDISTAKQFCALAQPEQLPVINELEKQFMMEFDFTREGWALGTVYDNIMPLFSDRVVIPKPVPGMATKNVLVMERLHGGVKLVDGIMDQYKAIAEANGMTLESLRERAEKEATEDKRSIAKRPAAWQIWVYVQYLRAKHAVANWAIAAYNYTLGAATRHRVEYYRPVKAPLNHARLMDTLLRVHGHQIFVDGVFNADPHPGNILLMPDGRLGLIDYGQVKVMSLEDRKRLARLMVALVGGDSAEIVQRVTELGLRTEFMDPWVLEKTAILYFDRDTPDVTDGLGLQQFSEKLHNRDKLQDPADNFIMVARTGVILRGTATLLQYPVSTAQAWLPYAKLILDETKYPSASR